MSKKRVVSELALFLNALPRQILAGEKKVVNFLLSHPDIFSKFQNGCHYVKWEIYQSIRYGNTGRVAMA